MCLSVIIYREVENHPRWSGFSNPPSTKTYATFNIFIKGYLDKALTLLSRNNLKKIITTILNIRTDISTPWRLPFFKKKYGDKTSLTCPITFIVYEIEIKIKIGSTTNRTLFYIYLFFQRCYVIYTQPLKHPWLLLATPSSSRPTFFNFLLYQLFFFLFINFPFLSYTFFFFS